MDRSSLPESVVLRQLIEKQLHIAFAESCTGGLAVARLVDLPSASEVLSESFVTYSEEAKIKRLGVLKKTIDRFGVVSEEVAGEMASGAAKCASAEVGIGISGIAGPTGGTAEKPVGTVCFGFSIKGNRVTSTQHFGEIGRAEVRRKSVDYVFRELSALLTNMI